MNKIRITFWNLGTMVKDLGERIKWGRMAAYGKDIREKA